MKYHLPEYVYLYNGSRDKNLNFDEILLYLKSLFKKVEFSIREDIIQYALLRLATDHRKNFFIDNLAYNLAKIKVRDIYKEKFFEPLQGEIEYEKSIITNVDKKSFGIIYDGWSLVRIFSDMLDENERNFKYCHIFITSRLFATYDENDKKYHSRASIYSFPSVVSTTGIVEAPAKPPEFYIKKQLKVNIYTLKEEFKDKFIDYDDQRMTEVLKGYILQAIFYHIFKDPFCENKSCRLYNAHWQEELIYSQINNKEICGYHKNLLNFLQN